MASRLQNSLILVATASLLLLAAIGFVNPVFMDVAISAFAGVAIVLGVHFLFFKKQLFVLLIFGLVPFSHEIELPFTDAALSMPSELMLSAISLILLISVVQKGVDRSVLRHPISIILILDVVWMLVTTSTSSDTIISLKRVAMRVNFVLLGYFFLMHWYRDKRALLKPLLFYVFGLIPVVAIIINAHSRYDFAQNISFAIPEPYYDEHTVYAACIAFIIPVFAWVVFKTEIITKDYGSRVMLMLGFMVIMGGILFAYSRAAWMSLVAAMFFGLALYLRIKLKTYLLISIIGVAVLAMAYPSIYHKISKNEAVSNDGSVTNHVTSVTNISTDASNLERINRWVCAWRMFKERPLLGFGPGTYQFEYAQFQTADYTTYISTAKGDKGNAHSEYLMYLSETGIVGFLIFLSLVVYTLFLGIRNNLRARGYVRGVNNAVLLGLFTFFIHGVFNSFIDQDKMALLVYPSIAVIAAIDLFHIRRLHEKVVETT